MRYEKLLKRQYYAQQLNTPYIFDGVDITEILTSTPSPADLDRDDTLDYFEKTAIDDTAEALQIEKTFVLVPDLLDTAGETWNYEGLARLVASLSLKKTDSTEGSVTISKVSAEIGTCEADIYGQLVLSSMFSTEAEIDYSNTTENFQNLSAQLFKELSSFNIPSTKRLYVTIKVYGYVTGEGVTGVIRLNVSRGSADTYFEVSTAEVQ